MTKLEIFLAVWGVFNAASRAIPDALWAKLPHWLQALLGFSRALGPGDLGKALQKGKAVVNGPDAG